MSTLEEYGKCKCCGRPVLIVPTNSTFMTPVHVCPDKQRVYSS